MKAAPKSVVYDVPLEWREFFGLIATGNRLPAPSSGLRIGAVYVSVQASLAFRELLITPALRLGTSDTGFLAGSCGHLAELVEECGALEI